MFYTTTTLGPNSGTTPEGFLIFRDVPIARTGLQTYGPGETPLDVGPDGYVKVERLEEDVFDPDCIASFEGKPICIDHPTDDVDPKNFRTLTRGHVQNVHRGEGVNSDVLLGDMLLMDHEAIDAYRSGINEVSCGYDAKYEMLAPGHARQHTIRGNHVAMVRGARCGPRCSMRDHAVQVKVHDSACCGARDDRTRSRGGSRMSKFKELFARFRDTAEAIEKELEGEGGEGGAIVDPARGTPAAREADTHIHIHRDTRREPHFDRRSRDDELGVENPDSPADVELLDRVESMERDLEEMKAQHEEMNDLLEDLADEEASEEERQEAMDRARDYVRRGRDRRGSRDRHRDARDRRRMHDDARRHYADLRRAHDEDPEEKREEEQWKEEEKDLRAADAELRREDCAMDAARRHRDAMKRHLDRRRSSHDAVEEENRKIEGELEAEAPPGTGDRARKARDSVYLSDSWRDTVAIAEILVPGQPFPTFDRAAAPKATLEKICSFRRRTLDLAYVSPAMRGTIDDLSPGRDYSKARDSMSCGAYRSLFVAVGAVKKAQNNGPGDARASVAVRDSNAAAAVGYITSGADIQKRNQEFWSKRQANV